MKPDSLERVVCVFNQRAMVALGAPGVPAHLDRVMEKQHVKEKER